MPTFKIFAQSCNPNANKALIAARYGGVDAGLVEGFQFGVDNRKPEYLAIAPLGKVPALDGPEGPVWESNAIARYIARVGNDTEGLLGSGPYESSIVDQWIEFTVSYVHNYSFQLFMFLFGMAPYEKSTVDNALKNTEQAFKWLEDHFTKEKAKFLVNDRVTLADIILGATLANPLRMTLSPDFRAQFPKTMQYFDKLYKEENIQAVLGPVEYCQCLPQQMQQPQQPSEDDE